MMRPRPRMTRRERAADDARASMTPTTCERERWVDDVTTRTNLPARHRSICTEIGALRPSLARHAKTTLELLSPRAADAQPRATLELYLVVAARTAVKRVDEVDAHDDRAMDAEEALGV